MDLNRFQQLALKTDKLGQLDEEKQLMIPLLGLAGEAGGLLTEFKKRMRDPGYLVFKERIAEELGDILWYVSNIASRQGLELGAIASKNLVKNQERWPLDAGTQVTFLDDGFDEQQQLPRRFEVELREVLEPKKPPRVDFYIDGTQFGDPLTDNAYEDDGYRFHDAFHFAHVAYLGWSPVVRKLLDRKRRSDKQKDLVEDGGRAAVIEESIVAFVYNDASRHALYEHTDQLDNTLLQTIRELVSGLEVNQRTASDWQRAILGGYAAFRELTKHGGGILLVDQHKRELRFKRVRRRRP